MLDALPMLFGLLAYGLPFTLCIGAFVVARNRRVRGERGVSAATEVPAVAPREGPVAPTRPSSRRFGLIGLAASTGAWIGGFMVPLTALGGAVGNTAAVALMALAAAGAALGAAALGQRRSMWAGSFAILLGLVAWLCGGALLFLSNVGMGSHGRPLRVRGVWRPMWTSKQPTETFSLGTTCSVVATETVVIGDREGRAADHDLHGRDAARTWSRPR